MTDKNDFNIPVGAIKFCSGITAVALLLGAIPTFIFNPILAFLMGIMAIVILCLCSTLVRYLYNIQEQSKMMNEILTTLRKNNMNTTY